MPKPRAPRPAEVINCGGCDQTWTALGAAHCAAPGGHRTFSTVRLFDLPTELTRCPGDGPFQLATPAPTCPTCGGHDVTTDYTDPWADHTRCGGCGWSARRSLGD